MQGYTYTKGEHYPMEHLVFKVAPEDVERYLEVDHEIWTLKEAYAPGFDHIPFLYKEVWLNDNKPGEIHFIFAWESIESWREIDQKEYQAQLIKEFDEKFGRPYELIRRTRRTSACTATAALRESDWEENEMKFADKVVIITGASSGIGEGVAKKFLAEGAKVVGCGVEPEMHIQDENAIYVQADLTDAAQACRVVEEAVKAFGRVNKLVCCAGVTFIGSLETTDYDKFMRELSINLGGVFNMCKAAVVELKKQEGSTIVTVGSDLGVRPIPERIGYCPSKAGVIMLTKCIALEFAPHIRANAILPGLVRTPMIEQRFTEAEDPAALEESYASLYPLHKMGKIEDMANAIAFLSSDESGFITGEIMQVCGGSLI